MAGEYLDGVLASDRYSEALTIGPDFEAERANIVIEENDCYMQFATGRVGQWYWNDEREFRAIPQSLLVGRIVGVRFRNYTPGAPAKITANLITPTDPDFISGVPLAASTAVTVAGWIDLSDRGTFTFNSADAPTYVLNTPTNLTGVIPVGARFSLVQAGFGQYFIVTAITAATITLYGGTDYTAAAGAITQPNYSTSKVPLGFPADPTKWTVQLTDTASRAQAAPVALTWYNLGSLQIVLPIGAWRVNYQVSLQVDSGAGEANVFGALSTVNNNASDSELIAAVRNLDSSTVSASAIETQNRDKVLSVAAKTTYFLNGMTTAGTTIAFAGNFAPTIVRAVCAYL